MKRGTIGLTIVLGMVFAIDVAAKQPLTFEERVKAQEAIERVYYTHRIWPKENPQPKPAFEKMVIKEQIEAKVTDYLKKSAALGEFWQRPITGEQLQAEMERMAKGTKDPQTLNELFAALNNEPYLIAECLAKPILADRLIRNWYASDERFHGETRAKAEEALKTLTPENFCNIEGTVHGKVTYRLKGNRDERDLSEIEDRAISLTEEEFAKMLVQTPGQGKISGIIEESDRFVVYHSIVKNEAELEIESLSFPKESLDAWLDTQNPLPALPGTEQSNEGFYLPPTPESSCAEGWDNGILDDVPDGRNTHTAIWTGTEMIVWGGYNSSYLNTGGRYNPSTDTWVPTSRGVNVPVGRYIHTAVWTGTEMIVWGGNIGGFTNTGGRYNPSTDTWTATSTGTGVPAARYYHTAVWTGTEMVVWGGYSGSYLNSGGRYKPSDNSWTATSTGTNVPAGRYGHSAVWTGTEMIVWGGYNGAYVNTGGKYDPAGDSWASTSTGTNVPAGREYPTAVWTGDEMIVWGGVGSGSSCLNSGGKYYPSTDSWISTSTETNCPSARYNHTAVWAGTEMIVWGGVKSGTYYNSGGRYNPSADTWLTTSTETNVPSARDRHSAVWTGTEMIIWGGNSYFNTGGKYDPTTDSWVATSANTNCPSPRIYQTAVWTGTEMIVWGGSGYINTGAKYYLSTDSWSPTSTGANVPAGRQYHTAIWTGSEMIVWGGSGSSTVLIKTGGRYNPSTDTWVATSTGTNSPSKRNAHTAVWTGTEMIIWGGYLGASPYYTNTGGRYNPSYDTWTATSTGTNCPAARYYHTAVWTGTEMIVWGGFSSSLYINTGGRYNPSDDSWAVTSTGTNVPEIRGWHTAVWTGTAMAVWGGYNSTSGTLNTGGRYTASDDTWITTSTGTNCPSKRQYHTAVWTGASMIIWGGGDNTGGKYSPAADTWVPTLSGETIPAGRQYHSAVWTGNDMIVWGGMNSVTYFNSGGRYFIPCPPSGIANNTASDVNICNDLGVKTDWSSPSNWGDGGSGIRTFDVLRDGTPIASGLSELTLSYTDTTGDNGVSYLYSVRANNGCGLSTATTGVLSADEVGTIPGEAYESGTCDWDPVPGAEGYRVYRGIYSDLPNLMNPNPEGCLRYQGPATTFDCSPDDPALLTDRLYWYLVTAYIGACEGTAGEGTGFTRNLTKSGDCF